MQISACPLDAVASGFKAVADPTRIRILATLLAAGELCVCHVEAALGITQSRASRHLATLRRAGLVVGRRDGAWVHYRVPDEPDPTARLVLAAVRECAGRDPDVRRLAARAAALRVGTACAGGAR